MKEFPKEVVSRYIGSGGSNCPYCGSPDISSQEPTYKINRIFDRIKCGMCCGEWYEIYRLTEIEMIGEEENDGY